MADYFEWNNKGSISRVSIDNFLNMANSRIENAPGSLPFKTADGMIVLSWLRALADRKPSEYTIGIAK